MVMLYNQPEAALALCFDACLFAQSGYPVFATLNPNRIQVAPGLDRTISALRCRVWAARMCASNSWSAWARALGARSSQS
jgi:hypothetical protein